MGEIFTWDTWARKKHTHHNEKQSPPFLYLIYSEKFPKAVRVHNRAGWQVVSKTFCNLIVEDLWVFNQKFIESDMKERPQSRMRGE